MVLFGKTEVISSEKILLSTFVTIITFSTPIFGKIQAAVDQDYNSFTFSNGNRANTYHWFTYVDTQCGMNTIAKYSAVTQSNVDKMQVDWTAYNVTGTEQDWGFIQYLKKIIYMINL